MLTKSADVVWSRLNGIICVYKPAEATIEYLKYKIRDKICEGLNALETRPPKKYIDVDYRTDGSISVEVRPCYADTILSVGERYQPQFIELVCASPLGRRASGVTVFGINGGCYDANRLRKAYLTKCFHLKGVFGLATNDFHYNSRVIGRAKYHRVTKYLVDKILASYQASHQQQVFKEKDINPNSQEAYELAAKGFYRPENRGNPLIYSLKCVEFDPPDFKLEVQCINETEEYLMKMIHNLGISLKTLGCCAGLRCLRQGPFHVDHSLLIKHLTLQNIIDNMQLCSDILNKNFSERIKHEPMVRIKDSLEEERKSDKRNEKLVES